MACQSAHSAILDNTVYKPFRKDNNKLIDMKLCKDALKESDFSETLNYIAPTTSKEQINRKRKMVWFKIPFSRSVKSNIDKTFLRLLSKHFPRNQFNYIFSQQ